MPYFVYRITAPKKLTLIDRFDAYREARDFARSTRAALDPAADATIKVMFAPNQEQAEAMLKMEREPRPLGEDA